RKDLLVVKRYQAQHSNDIPSVVATVIASRSPLTAEDLAIAQRQAKQMEFDLILTPKFAADPQLAAVADSSDPYATAATFPINVAPPTDDKPFFFNMTRMRDAFNPTKWQGQWPDVNLNAVQV